MNASAPSIDLPPRFRVQRHVASGGMASVWAAEDATLGRTVAIKLLAEQFLSDATAAERFQREARAAASLSSHPNVVTIFDVGEHAGRPYIVMEYMDGGSLADVLRAGRPPRADALRWLEEAAGALDAAHERGIVHRDVKPANLLLDSRRRLAVADFGIARVGVEQSLTSTGIVLGTAAYLSPEQARDGSAGPASDRYALAVVAYELLSGARPFAGSGFAAQARAHLEDDPVPVSDQPAGDVPASADPVLLRGLHKDPDARWPSASAFVQALEGALGEPDPMQTAETEVAPTRPLLAGAGAAAPAPRRTVAPPVGAAPAAPGERRWGPVFAGLAIVLALVALVGLVAVLSGGGDEPRTASDSPPAQTQSTDAAAAPAPGDADGSGDATSIAALNDEGFRLINAGRPADAIAPLEQAVERCGDSTELTCAYALYNLGHALRLAGRPAEAIPILERRLEIPNQQDVVARELELARQEAGVSTDSGGGDDERGGNGKGKGNGGGKGKD